MRGMYEFLKGLHNLIRWVVVLGGVVALVTTIRGLATRAAWTAREARAGLVFLSSLHLQLVLGLILYAVTPLVSGGMSARMAGGTLLIEHAVTMLLAIAAAQAGYSLSKRAEDDSAKYLRATVGYLVAALFIVLATPWGAALVPWG